MEAMTIGYPPERAGQICVTATKEEWERVYDSLFGEAPMQVNLVDALRSVGIGEE